MRFVGVELEIKYDFYDEEKKREFDKLGAESDDPIGQFIKLAKARGDTKDTDPVLLELLIALHRKVDELSAYIKNEQKKLLDLQFTSKIIAMGFDYFKLSDNLLPNKKYYGRIDLPVFPKREIAVIFETYKDNIAKILFMHERDEKDYNAYLMARERAIIRELKSKK